MDNARLEEAIITLEDLIEDAIDEGNPKKAQFYIQQKEKLEVRLNLWKSKHRKSIMESLEEF